MATDATPSSGGSTRATAPAGLVKKLFHRSCRRGKQLRLDGSRPVEVEEETNYLQSDVIGALGNQLKWCITKQYSFRETSHINSQELRAIKKEVTDWARTGNDSIRGNIHCGLCDLAVAIGVVNNGRSSSYKLNGILRSMLCNMIVTGSTIALNYINTHFNPADYPSRGAPLPTEMTGSAAVP